MAITINRLRKIGSPIRESQIKSIPLIESKKVLGQTTKIKKLGHFLDRAKKKGIEIHINRSNRLILECTTGIRETNGPQLSCKTSMISLKTPGLKITVPQSAGEKKARLKMKPVH